MITLSLLALRPGRMGGAETYARGLTRALAEHGTLEYRCLVPLGAEDAANGLATLVDSRVRADVGRSRAWSLRPRTVPGAVHYLFTAPLPPTRRPHAVTVQDLLHLERPELFPRSRRLYRRLMYDAFAARADRILVASAYVRDAVVERLGVPADRVHVAPYGLDHGRLGPTNESREPFLFYPARAWPHKNHARLYDAFALVRDSHPELTLVLAGDDHGELPRGVVSLGRISRDELIARYRRAAALVFPSLNEGFGFPPLEAMACGCPVAVARTTSLPEVCGDTAEYFDPRSAEDIAAGIQRALTAPPERIAAGVAHAATFTWQRTAAEHDRMYAALATR